MGAVQLKDNDIFTDKRAHKGDNTPGRNRVAAVSFWPSVLFHCCGQHKEML